MLIGILGGGSRERSTLVCLNGKGLIDYETEGGEVINTVGV